MKFIHSHTTNLVTHIQRGSDIHADVSAEYAHTNRVYYKHKIYGHHIALGELREHT